MIPNAKVPNGKENSLTMWQNSGLFLPFILTFTLMNTSETPEPKDLEKNTSKAEVGDDIPCPYWLELIPYCFTFVFLSYISYKYLDPVPAVWKFPIFAKVFACFCIIHWCFILGERWYSFGSAGFYEIYWYCNMAMLLTSVGIVFGLPSLIGQCMCLTLFPHISFWVDILLTPCMKRSPIGSAGWMFEKSTPWHERVSSLHHFWYFPCIFILFYKQDPIPISSYWMSLVQFVIMNFFSRLMSPKSCVDKSGKLRELNICVSWVCPDFIANIPPFKWSAGNPYIVHLLIATLFYNVPINFLAYAIIFGVQKLINMI